MTDPALTSEERRTLLLALERGDPPLCPGCGATMDARPVRPRPDVAYVRDRVWLVCPRCHRSVVVDHTERR